MQSHYIITIIGEDRPGLVEAVSATVSAHEGNWLESRFSQLGGKFAGLVSLTLSEGSADALETELKSLFPGKLSMRLTWVDNKLGSFTQEPANIAISLIGPDRKGIVHEVSAALSDRGVNMLEMETRVSSAPMTGEPLFEATVTGFMADEERLNDLLEHLDEIANEMTLDIDLERT
ncbi:MAG: glycine cleavage system regulatory protein [Halieaceae bacterium]|jgi:glycine cleavage system regulatory protein